MAAIEQAKTAILALKGSDRYRTMVEIAAILTELLEPNGVKPVIVGGLAVEIYTRSQYTTMDVDLIVSRRDLAKHILEQLGFVQEGRHWYHPEVDASIEIPGEQLAGASEDKITRITLSSGRHVYVIGLEDLILDRLSACVYWKSYLDCEWAQRMVKLHYDILDLEYLLGQAGKEPGELLATLNTWLSAVGEI